MSDNLITGPLEAESIFIDPIILSSFSFESINKTIFMVKVDGSVVLGPGISLDEATLAFWSHVLQNSPIRDFIEKAKRLDDAVIRVLGPELPGNAFGNFHEALEKILKVQNATGTRSNSSSDPAKP